MESAEFRRVYRSRKESRPFQPAASPGLPSAERCRAELPTVVILTTEPTGASSYNEYYNEDNARTRLSRERVLSMKFRNLVVLCTCVLAATTGRAQNAPTQQDLEVRLKSQFLMLRGMWDGDRLAFDRQGNLFGSAEKTFFSLSAVIVTQIQLGDTQLDIHGRRAGFEFSYSKPLHQPPHTPPYDLAAGLMIGAKPYSNVEIEIARDSAHPEALDDAINKVFSIGNR